MDRRTLAMSYDTYSFNYNVFILLKHVLLMFLFICTEINQIKISPVATKLFGLLGKSIDHALQPTG